MTDNVLPWIEEDYRPPEDYDWNARIDIYFSCYTDDNDDESLVQDTEIATLPGRFDSIIIGGVITSFSDDTVKLLNSLRNDDWFWKVVRFFAQGRRQPNSPVFMAMLITAMRKSKCVEVGRRDLDTAAFSVLATGLLGQDGIQEIELYDSLQLFWLKPCASDGEKVFEGRTLQNLVLESAIASDSDDLEGLYNAFPNLTDLSLQYNEICDLTSLECILCKENFFDQDKTDEESSAFALGLQSVSRDNTLCASLQPFLESANQSRSLERISMDCEMDAVDLCHTMNVNRGIRYGTETESAALLPQILHRASSISYFAGIEGHWCGNVDSPTDKTTRTRASVVFSLLRDNANLFERCGKPDEDVPSPPASKKRRLG
ncbi:unnamed protein product [Cylindrotheca closterium]|uniref:Uncharacterized protein n=1 Tax=Cylindrotheca closterium TaxID=2856 RepID=A0AAD2CQY6_9STRA|nr:unnamed protein product [Cylindrotheca closterium]